MEKYINTIRSANIIVVTCLLVTFFISAQSYAACTQRAVTTKSTTVYDQPPYFSTARGWNYGRAIHTLPKGTNIYICQTKSISFGILTSTTWFQIAYRLSNTWKYGWIGSPGVRQLSGNGTPQPDTANLFDHFSFIGTALAQAPTPSESTSTVNGAPPPPPSSGIATNQIGASDASPLYTFYSILFVAMLIGMIAKYISDLLQIKKSLTAKEHLLHIFAPVVISPMVFLAFMQTADFVSYGDGTKNFIVLLLLSFQNGFFWQTVLSARVKQPQPVTT